MRHIVPVAVRTVVFLFLVFLPAISPAQSKQTIQDKMAVSDFLNTLPHVQWKENSPGCNLIFSGGTPVQILSTDGLDLVVGQAGFEEHPSRLAFIVIAVNKTKGPLNVQPDLFWAVGREPKEKYMAFVSPEEIGKSLQRSAQWRGALLGLSGALATQTVTTNSNTNGTWNGTVGDTSTNGTFDGTTTSTTTVPDEAARQRALAQASAIHETASNQSDAADAFALRRNTLFPGQKISGIVWFKSDKHTRTADLLIPITDAKHSFGAIYVFPEQILGK